MGLEALGGKTTNGTTSNDTREDRSSRRTNQRRDDRRDDRRRSDEERETTNDAMTSIRAATQNRYGTISNPSRSLSALKKYADDYIEARTKVVAKDNESYYTVIVEKGVAVPAVVVLMRINTDDKPMFIGHAIMLVDFKVKPQPLSSDNIGGIRYVHNTVWADALDEEYLIAIERQITTQLQVEEPIYLDAGCTTMSSDLIPTEKMLNENNFQSQTIDNLIFWVLSGVDAIRSVEAEDDSRAIRPEVANPDATVVADISLAPSTTLNVAGLPIAEDFLIRLSEVTDDRNRRDDRQRIRSLNDTTTDAGKTYGAIGGRIDFTLVEPIEPNPRSPRLEDSACLLPEFIISNQDVGDQAVTLPTLLQLISAAGVLDTRDPPIFLEAFDPRNISSSPSRNIGALNAYLRDPEGRAQERLATMNGVDAEMFRKFTRAAIVPGSRIGIEVPSQGPLVGVLGIFAGAINYALGDKNSKEYNDHLIHACDILTGGEFGDAWGDDAAPIMIAERHVIPTGYWVDETQQPRDSRELGFLYYANLDNPREAMEMSMAYARSFMEEDQLIAAQERLKLIVEAKGANFVQTDNVVRGYFDRDFISILNQSLRRAGLGISTPNTRYSGRGSERRRVDDKSGFISRSTLDSEYGRYSGRDRDRSHNRTSYGRRSYYRR